MAQKTWKCKHVGGKLTTVASSSPQESANWVLRPQTALYVNLAECRSCILHSENSLKTNPSINLSANFADKFAVQTKG